MNPLSESKEAAATECLRSQKTIGLIGGTSWESTLVYYKMINEAIRDRLGGLNSAQLLIYSLNYDPIVRLEQLEKWEEVGKQLAQAAQTLQNAGADFLILCCNTLHKVTPFIEKAITMPFLHIADPAGSILSDHQVKKVGLLGTQFTMEDGFYASRLKEKFALEVLVPHLQERKQMDAIIYQELCQGKIVQNSKAAAIHIIQNLKNAGAEAVLLACTELGMLIDKEDADIPIYDTTVLHAEGTVRMALLEIN